MSTDFTVITEEFGEDLDAIRALVNAFDGPPTGAPKPRIAAANSATLLLAATFEEFVREMARAYARSVVAATQSVEMLPPNLAGTAWRRTMRKLAGLRVETKTGTFATLVSDAQSKFNAVSKFCRGDLSQDIYQELIHNENNMRPSEINSLFKVSNLGNICEKISDKQPLLQIFGKSEQNNTHSHLISSIEEFIERRNSITHSLGLNRSSGPDQIIKDIEVLGAFGKSLCETLESLSQTEVATFGNTSSDEAEPPVPEGQP